jgi:urease accessory protein
LGTGGQWKAVLRSRNHRSLFTCSKYGTPNSSSDLYSKRMLSGERLTTPTMMRFVSDGSEGRTLSMIHRSWVVLALALLSTETASAHTGQGGLGGFQAGLAHPLFGLDHLLAMLAVGIWGAQMGGRRVWTLPVTFPLIMACGAIAGMAGLYLPDVELGIALSVLILGLAIAVAWRPFEWVALLIIAVFAVFHGYAHGVELPSAADPAAYSAGFVIATGAIHVIGIGIGLLLGKLLNGWVSRGLGGAIAVSGLYFFWA